jgi:hypothetical protein
MKGEEHNSLHFAIDQEDLKTIYCKTEWITNANEDNHS